VQQDYGRPGAVRCVPDLCAVVLDVPSASAMATARRHSREFVRSASSSPDRTAPRPGCTGPRSEMRSSRGLNSRISLHRYGSFAKGETGGEGETGGGFYLLHFDGRIMARSTTLLVGRHHAPRAEATQRRGARLVRQALRPGWASNSFGPGGCRSQARASPEASPPKSYCPL